MQKIEEHGDHVTQSNLIPDPSRSSASCTETSLNPDDFRQDLASFDLTKAQEDELLQTLWNIMSAFVDLGWGVDSVQMVLPGIFEEVSSNPPESINKDKYSDTVINNRKGTA